MTAWPRRPTYSGRGAVTPSHGLGKHFIGPASVQLQASVGPGKAGDTYGGAGSAAAAVLASASSSSEQKANAVLQALASEVVRPHSASDTAAPRTGGQRAAALRRAGAAAQGPSSQRPGNDRLEFGADIAQAQLLQDANKIGGQPGVTVSGNAVSSTSAPSGAGRLSEPQHRRGSAPGMPIPIATGIAPQRQVNGTGVAHSSRGRRDAAELRPGTPGTAGIPPAMGSARLPIRPNVTRGARGCWSGGNDPSQGNHSPPSGPRSASPSRATSTPVAGQHAVSKRPATTPAGTRATRSSIGTYESRHVGFDLGRDVVRPATAAGFNAIDCQETTAGVDATKAESFSKARPYSAGGSAIPRSALSLLGGISPQMPPMVNGKTPVLQGSDGQALHDGTSAVGLNPYTPGGDDCGDGVSFPPLVPTGPHEDHSPDSWMAVQAIPVGTSASADASVTRIGNTSVLRPNSRPISPACETKHKQALPRDWTAAADDRFREDGAASSARPAVTALATASLVAAGFKAGAPSDRNEGLEAQVETSRKPPETSLPPALPRADSPRDVPESLSRRGSSKPPPAQTKKVRTEKPPTPPIKVVNSRAVDVAPKLSSAKSDKDSALHRRTAREDVLLGIGVDGETECVLLGTENLPLMGAAGVLVLPKSLSSDSGRGCRNVQLSVEEDLISFGKEELTGWGSDCLREELSSDRLLENARRDRDFLEYASASASSSEVTECLWLDPASMEQLIELAAEQTASNWTPSQGPTLIQLAHDPKRREECPVCNVEWTRVARHLNQQLERDAATAATAATVVAKAAPVEPRRRTVTGRAKMHSVRCCFTWYQQSLCSRLCDLRFDDQGFLRTVSVNPNRVLPPPILDVVSHWKQKGGRGAPTNQAGVSDRLAKGEPPSNQA